jgi:hypothetical protein
MPGSLELRYAEIKDPVSKLGGRKLACGFIGSEVRSSLRSLLQVEGVRDNEPDLYNAPFVFWPARWVQVPDRLLVPVG